MENTIDKVRIKAIIYIIIAATLLSTGGIILKYVDMNPMAIAGSRGFIAAIVVLIYLKKPKFTFSKPQVFGAISYATMVTTYTIANKLTTATNAVVLQFTAPIWLIILGVWFLKEKVHWYDIVSIIVVSGGMLLFFIDDVGGGSLAGNLVAILSGIALAGTTISLSLQKEGSPVETTLLGHIITFIVTLPFIFKADFTTANIIGVFMLGTFQLGIAYILYSTAVKYLSALEVILIMFLEPLLNPIWVMLIHGETPSKFSIIGGTIVILTVAVRSIVVSKQSKNKSKQLKNIGD